MTKDRHDLPKHYSTIMAKHPKLSQALDSLGEAIREEGPINAKTGHLIQLAAAASIRSEGSVHSHTRRALESGATPAEIRHSLILLVSTVGFPTVASALSWANDILEDRQARTSD